MPFKIPLETKLIEKKINIQSTSLQNFLNVHNDMILMIKIGMTTFCSNNLFKFSE